MALIFSRRRVIATSVSAGVLCTNAHAQDAQNTVEMFTRHPDDRNLRNVFSPRLMVVEAGETVLFKATERGHNSASIDGMIPDGAAPWSGRLNSDIDVSFDVPGFYGYVCTPHASLGMVGLVVVRGDGMLNNLETARGVRQRGKAASAFEEIWAEAEEAGLLS